jgi:hypothetical protein
MLNASVPGCPYDDYGAPARTGRTMCLEQCHKDSDCRTNDGYICADPRQPPWNAVIVDDDQAQLVCVVAPDEYDGGAVASFADAAVCQSMGPSVPGIDAGGGVGDAGSDAADGPVVEAAVDAGDGGDGAAIGDAVADGGDAAVAEAGPDTAEGGE